MDIVDKRRVKGGNGNAAAEYSDIISRACSWQRGADAACQDIDAEKMEEDSAFGIPNHSASENGKGLPKGGRTDGVA
jgi:hypothetical protein